MHRHQKIVIGRYEWCQLPLLNIPYIKAKVDTGAKTSAIHAFDIKAFHRAGLLYVRFKVNPIQGNDDFYIQCKTRVIDTRYIMSSNGHKERRYVISSNLVLGEHTWPIELTLSNRDPLRFRMLLGLQALQTRAIIDPSLKYKQMKVSANKLQEAYDV